MMIITVMVVVVVIRYKALSLNILHLFVCSFLMMPGATRLDHHMEAYFNSLGSLAANSHSPSGSSNNNNNNIIYNYYLYGNVVVVVLISFEGDMYRLCSLC